MASTNNPECPILLKTKNERPSDEPCAICNGTLSLPRHDGSVETAVILPCAHVFGSQCIARWLQSSPHHDCPQCRRVMVYSDCGHIIQACEVEAAPRSVSEGAMPRRCLRCCWGRIMELEFRGLEKRRRWEKRSLAVLDISEGARRGTKAVVEEELEDIRQAWRTEVDMAVRNFEEREGRSQW